MVINDRYRFIFVHVPKSAGTSISATLSDLPGHNDTCGHPRTRHETLCEMFARVGSGSLVSSEGPDLTCYLPFGFVRNPWARMTSLYRYLVETRPRAEIVTVTSFEDFLRQARAGTAWIAGLHSMRPQLDFFESSQSSSFIGHHEYLQEDFAAVSRVLGFEATLPRTNWSSNSVGDYRSDYTTELVDIVGALFWRDVAMFGYDFETLTPRRRVSDLRALTPLDATAARPVTA